MANIAIKLMVGNHPDHMACGCCYHFQVGGPDSKVSPQDLKGKLQLALEECLEKMFGDNPINLNKVGDNGTQKNTEEN